MRERERGKGVTYPGSGRALFTDRASEPKVGQLDGPVRAYEEIRGLDVAVDDGPLVAEEDGL